MNDKIPSQTEVESFGFSPYGTSVNGLQRLHDLGYVHRDLNPNNILLHEGTWKLSDLGAVLPPSGKTVTLTEDTIIYTERYCAPEQRQDFHQAQPPADVYSFGCILHDLFGSTPRTPYHKHSAPGGMGVIIEKCTDPKPAKRPTIEKLRPLVLDTLIEEGGHCKVEDAQASEWLGKLEKITEWKDDEFESFARFFADLDTKERTGGNEMGYVYSLSTPFLTRLSTQVVQRIVERKDGLSAAIIEKYCTWARGTAYEFSFSDNICIRLNVIFDYGTPADKAQAFAALVALGESHNRWFIMRCMLNRCRSEKTSTELAKRLAIELKTEDLEYAFRRCVQVIRFDTKTLAPELAKVCG